jgi:hypothetical protein
VFHEMNLSCIVLTLHDPDPKLNLNDFCRSQERHRPACPGYSSLTAPPQALDTGVRPIRQHSRWPSHPISISRSGRNVPVLCQPALSDRGDEQWRGRSPTPPPPQGGGGGSSPARSDAAAPLWGRSDSSAATVLVLGRAAAGDSLAGRPPRTCPCRWAPTHSCREAGWQ